LSCSCHRRERSPESLAAGDTLTSSPSGGRAASDLPEPAGRIHTPLDAHSATARALLSRSLSRPSSFLESSARRVRFRVVPARSAFAARKIKVNTRATEIVSATGAESGATPGQIAPPGLLARGSGIAPVSRPALRPADDVDDQMRCLHAEARRSRRREIVATR